jgi:predicted transcriptional regulator
MPSGVYERKPWMKNCGRTAPFWADIVTEQRAGATIGALARRYQVTRNTIRAILKGDWNEPRNLRRRQVQAQSGTLRAHSLEVQRLEVHR